MGIALLFEWCMIIRATSKWDFKMKSRTRISRKETFGGSKDTYFWQHSYSLRWNATSLVPTEITLS